MSVLTKGLAMDFEREGRDNMAITSVWPAAVCQKLFLNLISNPADPFKAIQSAATGDPSVQHELRKPVRTVVGNPEVLADRYSQYFPMLYLLCCELLQVSSMAVLS